jgi:uncharacterized protein (DUF983 family)
MDFLSGCTIGCASHIDLSQLRAQMVGAGPRCKHCGSGQEFPGAHVHSSNRCACCEELIASGEIRSQKDLEAELQRDITQSNPRTKFMS